MKSARFLLAVLFTFLMGICPGCSKEEDKAKPETNLPAAREEENNTGIAEKSPVRLSNVLTLWENKNQDEAVKQFLAIRWDDPAVFENVGMLNMSEQKFVSLPANSRTQIQQKAGDFSKMLRELARYVLATGETVAGSGDTAMARTHFQAVRAYGEALSKPDQLALIQMTGNSIVKAADSKLAALK